MILREMLSILEGKNHLGEPEQTTFAGWKRACRKVNPDVWFEGDKDIAQALVGPKPYKHGETKSIGEWDGEKGSVYAHAKKVDEAKGPKLKPQKFEPGWYVLDADNVPFHGPFKSDKEAGKELTKLSGRRGHGYHIDYIESIKESSDDEVTYKAWERAVKDQYPDLASKIKFKGNKDGDVEAMIPGVDRLYGIFDTEKNEGTVLGEGQLDEKRMEWHDSDAPDAEGKFKELGVKALGDWLIKTRNGDMKRINGSLTQQIVMNRKRDPAYAKKMESVREYVKGKLSKD